MTLAELLPLFAQGGLAAVIAGVFYKLHVGAIAAERRRADDARARAEAAERRADLREEQMGILLRGGVRDDRAREPVV